MASEIPSFEIPSPGCRLGIDVGSAQKKVASFCLIETDSTDRTIVHFEHGRGGDGYPKTNTGRLFLDPDRRGPTYLREGVETAIHEMLDGSELVTRWLDRARGGGPGLAVAVDAPVALATEGKERLTESASTQTFRTPTRETFEAALDHPKDEYLRVNILWKCVGFAVYRYLADRLEGRAVPFDTVAARTCEPWSEASTSPRIRETFPSDVYKRANGRQDPENRLAPAALDLLHHLSSTDVEWRGTHGVAPQTLQRLQAIKHFLHLELKAGLAQPCEMRKRQGTAGDLWDAFTCAFTVACEDLGVGELHGGQHPDQKRLRAEGAILTVRKG